MDTREPMEALRRRAFQARTPIYKLCEKAGVSATAFTRSAAGGNTSMSVLGKLERAMAEIELDKAQMLMAVREFLA